MYVYMWGVIYFYNIIFGILLGKAIIYMGIIMENGTIIGQCGVV